MQSQQERARELHKVRLREFALVTALVVAIGFPSLFWPLGGDQGIHTYVGASWLQGRLPFRDVWVQKGPLAFVPHVLVTALFARTMWGIRLFDFIWQIGCSWLMYIIARRRMRRIWALTSVGLYLLTYFAFGYWSTAHVEGFLLPFILLSVFFYERARSSSRPRLLLLVSGLCMGLSPWFKQTALVQVAGLFIWAAIDSWHSRKDRLRNLLVRWIALGIGVLIPTVLIISFLSAFGMLQPMLSIWRYSFFSYPNMGDTSNVSLLWRTSLAWASRYGLLAFPFLAGMGYFLFGQGQRRNWNGIFILALCSLAGVYAQRRLWEYQWVSTIPFMALIAANVIGDGVDAFLHCGVPRQRGMAWLLALMGLGLALPILCTHSEAYLNLAVYLSGRRSWLDYLGEFRMRGVFESVSYIRERTTNEDYLFIWGHYPMVYYLADRQNPTRFGMDPPLSLSHANQHPWQQECMRDLQAHPPAYVLVATDDITPFEPVDSKQQLQSFPEFAAFLDANYAYDRHVGDFDVHIRLAPPEYSMSAQFEEGIVLMGYDLAHEDLRPGGVVSVALHWSTVSPPETNYTVFVQLVDWSGPEVIAQSDNYPAHDKRPTSGWLPGEHVVDTHDLRLPPNLSAGEYEMIAGMYDLATLERLPVESGGTADNYVSLGKFLYEPDS